MKAEEERKKKEEIRLNGGVAPVSTKDGSSGSMVKLIMVNIMFFLVIAGGIMFISGGNFAPFDWFSKQAEGAVREEGL